MQNYFWTSLKKSLPSISNGRSVHPHFEHIDFVTPYGLAFVIAIATSWWLTRRNATTLGIHGSHIDLLLPLALAAGAGGVAILGRLFQADLFVAGNALQVDVRFRLFSLVVVAALAIFAYSRLHKLSFRTLMDAFALPAILALAILRIGCFLAGCCWGDVSVQDPWLTSIATSGIGSQIQTLPWLAGDWVLTAVQFPAGSFAYEQQLAIGLITADAERSLPVHPVQLYEAALLLVAFLVLRRVPLGKLQPGMIAAGAAITYAVIRFAIEYLRADGALAIGNLTITQLQCVVLLAVTAYAGRMSMNATH